MSNKSKQPKLFMGQNMTARAKSPVFWTGIVGIIGAAITSFGSLIGVDLTGQVDNISETAGSVINAVFLILGLLGVSASPTSKRFRDSEIEQEYKKPRDDEDPSEHVKWKVDADAEHHELKQENAKMRQEKDAEQAQIKKDMQDDDAEEEQQNTEKDDVQDIKEQVGIMKPEEFDTSQPFTDDSDEVEYDVADYEYDEELPLGASRYHDDKALEDGKEDESHKEDFIEDMDKVDTSSVKIDENEKSKDENKVIKKTIEEEVIKEDSGNEDKKESDK